MSKDAASNGKRSGKPRRERPPKPGDKPVDIATLQGSFVKKVMQVPGGFQVLMATGLTVLSSVMVVFTAQHVAQELGEDGETTAAPIFEAYGSTAQAAMWLVIPLVAAAVALSASLSPFRRRVWLAGAIIMMGVFFSTGAFVYLYPGGTLAWAYFRSTKIEGPAKASKRDEDGRDEGSIEGQVEEEDLVEGEDEATR